MKLKILLFIFVLVNSISIAYADNNDGYNVYSKSTIKELIKSAEQGHAKSQYSLALKYATGRGIAKDNHKAVKWYRKAAEQGHAEAQYFLAARYRLGMGVAKDNYKAVKWYKKSAEQGHAEAQYNLGFMYEIGSGVLKDYGEAVKWYKKAAEQDHAKSQYLLAAKYRLGRGVAKDNYKAVKWYKKSAEQGNKHAQTDLGYMYAKGKGVIKDDEKAVEFYRKAAEQGYALAQYNLGYKYDNGEGVVEDDNEAIKWYRESAKQGNVKAQYSLGVAYEFGRTGVDKNADLAIEFYKKSIRDGSTLDDKFKKLADQKILKLTAKVKNKSNNDYKDEKTYSWQGIGKGPMSDSQREELNNKDIVDMSWKGAHSRANKYYHKLGDYENALIWYLEARRLYIKEKNLSESSTAFKVKINRLKNKIGEKKYKNILTKYKDSLGRSLYNNNDDSGSLGYQYYLLGQKSCKKGDYKKALKWFKESKHQKYRGADYAIDNIDKNCVSDSNNYSNVAEKEDGRNNKQYSDGLHNASIDNAAPVIRLNQKKYLSVESQSFILSGSVKDESNVSEVTVNGGLIAVNNFGKFNKKVYLGLGKNKLTVEALDIFGNKSSKTITVVRNKAVIKNKDKKLTPPDKQLTISPNSVALIIGLDDYKNMTNAPWGENDAYTFYDYAHNALGIPIERIRLITGKESNGIGIWKSLEHWLPSQIDRNMSDIYVYFAGHGLASEDGKYAYLMPYDGETSMLSRTAILRKDVINGLKKLNAKSVTMFMDTCYSGSARGGKNTLVASRGLRIVKKNTLSDLPSNFTLFSAAANDETAISHPTQKNGLFSYWMMRGLGGEADSNNDRKLTNGELHSFISDKVQKTAISKGHKQHPQLVGDKDKVIASW